MTMTTREHTVELLQQLFDWKFNSLAGYIVDAESYTRPGDEKLTVILEEVSLQDKTLADEIAAAIRELKAIPHVNPPEQDVAELNYLSIAYLCSHLAERLEAQEKFASDRLEQLAGAPKIRELVAHFVQETGAQRRRLLQAMQGA